MKQLYLLRHAKTEAGGFFARDKERQLSNRGKQDTDVIAQHMRGKGLVPDQIICSTASRARATCRGLLTVFYRPVQVDYEDELYLAEAATLMAFAQGADEVGQSLMLIAHNPGMAALAFAMAGQRATLLPKLADFPTTALACFIFDCNHWTDLDPTKARLSHFITPRLLKDA